MATFPCPDFLRDCECENFPVRNFTQEEPDVPVFIGTFNNPPTTGTFFAPGCLAICESTVSQADADECAELQAEQCSIDNTPAVGNPVPSNRSTMQFTTASPLDAVCVDDVVLVAFNVIGGTAPYTFTQVSGDLPDGTSLDPDGTLSGTATAGGTFSFAVRATDSIGRTKTKSFSMGVIEITSPSKLPDAELGVPYEYTLLSIGASSPTWTVEVEGLPPGLSLSAAGVISGTPTVPGYYPFTVTLTDSTTECLKVFTIAFDPLEYWKLDEAAGNRVGSVNSVDLVPFDPVASAAGIIGNAWRWVDTAQGSLGTGHVSGMNATGSLSVSGWYRLDVRSDASAQLIFQWQFYDAGDNLVGSLNLWSSTNQFTLQINGVGSASVIVAYAITAGQWYFFHALYDVSSGKVTLEINNVAQGTSAASTARIASVTGNFILLSLAGAGNEYRVDEIAVRDYLPNVSELIAFYNGGVGQSWPLP